MFSEDEIDLITVQFQAHYGFVKGIVYRYAPADQLDDTVQEVFIQFFTGFAEKKWSLGQPQENWRLLLCHLAKRQAQLSARQQARRNRLVDQVAERLRQASGESPLKDDVEFLTESDRQMKAMKECLEKLPPKSRAIVEQYYFERISMGQIAEHQKTTLATVRNFFYRIRLKLRQCIDRTVDR